MSGDLGKFSVRTRGSDRLLVQSNSNQNAIINCLFSVVRRDEIFDDGKELILVLSHVERECLERHKRMRTNQTYSSITGLTKWLLLGKMATFLFSFSHQTFHMFLSP